jgi:predicted phage terminase large subunit-like protein
MSAYVFAGVYQQSPTAAEGNFFRRPTFRYWRRTKPWPDGRVRVECEGRLVTMADTWRFATMDVAASTKTGADYTVVSVWAVTVEGDLILLDRWRNRVADHNHFAMVEALRNTWDFDVLYVEKSWWSTTVVQDARDAGIPVAPLVADTDKVTRAVPAAGQLQAGKVWFPAETSGCPCAGPCAATTPPGQWLDEWLDELAAFPRGTHDDQVDTFSYAARVRSHEWVPAGKREQPPARPSPAEQAIAAAHRAATGNGDHPVDLMNMPLG